ncbi:TRAP transporter large permease [Phaeobacter sp. HF9A]|uniref:TRAP transporter large permease n=1 Tax=Phaeobacter sp. HF9A TaxID=2721561 RepID=UPI001431F854|nr:TRAP transporter large permease [Phaeobacter sp. HF9A]NIZ11968.1 TRAP transporter large permease [Phaeobacter sp. HF9A]
MSELEVTALVIGLLLSMMLLSVPIGAAMALSAFSGIMILYGSGTAFFMVGEVAMEVGFNYELCIIPLFILMGNLATKAGMSADLYQGCARLFGGVRGALAMATILACGCFAAVSGSSLATATALGRVSLPEMKRNNYSDALATGCVAAGGTIGVLIPPSIILVIYGVLTETSITDLFVAAVIPGLMQIVIYAATIAVIVRLWPGSAGNGQPTNLREKLAALPQISSMFILFALIIGGLYLGIFTPTEAAGFGVIFALAIGLLRRSITLSEMVEAVYSTIRTTGMIALIIFGAFLLINFFVLTRANIAIADYILSLDASPTLVLLIILLTYLILGCFLDSIGMVLLTVPVIFPIITGLGYDPVWFGIVLVIVVETGMITPPLGINVFAIKSIAPDIPLGTIFKGVMPFWGADLIRLALLVMFPALTLMLL